MNEHDAVKYLASGQPLSIFKYNCRYMAVRDSQKKYFLTINSQPLEARDVYDLISAMKEIAPIDEWSR